MVQRRRPDSRSLELVQYTRALPRCISIELAPSGNSFACLSILDFYYALVEFERIQREYSKNLGSVSMSHSHTRHHDTRLRLRLSCRLETMLSSGNLEVTFSTFSDLFLKRVTYFTYFADRISSRLKNKWRGQNKFNFSK
jgi:hypothetical protein